MKKKLTKRSLSNHSKIEGYYNIANSLSTQLLASLGKLSEYAEENGCEFTYQEVEESLSELISGFDYLDDFLEEKFLGNSST